MGITAAMSRVEAALAIGIGIVIVSGSGSVE